jgi:hypothetical protein
MKFVDLVHGHPPVMLRLEGEPRAFEIQMISLREAP